MALHCRLLYTPVLQSLFLHPALNWMEWKAGAGYISASVMKLVTLTPSPFATSTDRHPPSLLDEVLKFVERRFFIRSSTAVTQVSGKKEQ